MQDAGGARVICDCLRERLLEPPTEEENGDIVVFAISRAVWRAAASVHEQYLTDHERVQSNRYRHADDRRRFIVGRAVFRIIASVLMETAPLDISIRSTRYGRPVIDRTTLSINVSHSGDWILVAAADRTSVGVDVEAYSSSVDVVGVSAAVFSDWECQTLLGFAPSRQSRLFFDIWARKEAFIKADGRGIHFGLSRFDVEFRPGRPVRVRDVRADEKEIPEAIQLNAVHLDDMHAAALCYFGAKRRVSLYVASA